MSEPSSEDRILAGFSHLMIIFSWYGTAVAAVIWIVKKDRSVFVKYSVKQAVAYQIVALIILRIIAFLCGPKVGLAVALKGWPFLPQAVGAVWALVALGLFLYGVKGAFAAFQGKKFRYAVIGKFVDNILN